MRLSRDNMSEAGNSFEPRTFSGTRWTLGLWKRPVQGRTSDRILTENLGARAEIPGSPKPASRQREGNPLQLISSRRNYDGHVHHVFGAALGNHRLVSNGRHRH